MILKPTYEIFDHTADLGLRVRAATMAELVEPATRGLYSVIGQFVLVGNAEPFAAGLSGNNPGLLLRDFLAEALLTFETRHRLAVPLQVLTFTNNRLSLSGETRRVDADRSVYHREVKAVTYHELAIREIEDGFEATLILDI